MITSIRILGLSSLSILLFVYFTEWEFNNWWLPTVLINVCFLALFFEIGKSVKPGEKRANAGILLSMLQCLILYGSIETSGMLSHGFLNFRSPVYENDHLLIEQSDGFLGKRLHDTHDFYLLQFSPGKLLIKEVDRAQINLKEGECKVHFCKKTIVYDICAQQFYP